MEIKPISLKFMIKIKKAKITPINKQNNLPIPFYKNISLF